MLCCAVVVAGCNYYSHFGIGIVNPYQGIGKHGLHGIRWLRCVINIAANQENVGAVLFDNFLHLIKHSGLLFGSIEAVEGVA